ncbi:thiamine pyrophosphate-dependent enzyme [Methanoregula formicica]|uniref:Thiamine pyrophosphate-dependent enzyme, possible carboligase or decarboxylase n=1 Tax=Methanoregula formicica (strain DSM 22288 / NBRC 105244 / SMSP) TaxID=593750 RepID=L0HIQ3_METFS|nr:thiamine pyrophosphate-dependent enzyme [Methanoregula formicica]AGB02969.1 thiamine pyrophosphate-dependent enzyme, possible carboligase or decarboxylase [Methanoregula formicica SMSP]
MTTWRCSVCGYLYDEAAGIPSAGIAAGTPFSGLPDDWTCPVCGAAKSVFSLVAETDIHARAESTVSDVMAAELAAFGVRYVFGLPGTSSLGLVEAVRKNPDLTYIVFRHEANAAMAASAYAKLTGQVAACLTIAGPGATNLVTGLYDAKEDHAPVIALNGQSEVQYTGPGGVQEIDQDAFFRPVTVYNTTVADKSRAVLLLSRALKYALVERGVSQVSVPNNIQKQPLDASFCSRESCIPGFSIIPTEDVIRQAADRINAAERPVILAGWGAYPAGREVKKMAEKIGAPVLTTFRAKGILPEGSGWVLGILGNVGSPLARKTAEEADLLITLGVGFSKFTNVPADKPMVQVDIDPTKLGRNDKTLAVYANCTHLLPRLLPLLRQRETLTRKEEVSRMQREWDLQRDREADSTAVPIRPPYIMKVLSGLIPDNAVISLDVGENQWWFGRNFRMKQQRFVMSGYLATMGFGFPGALAAKLAFPDRPVFCITGDGGFSMAMADFVTAVKYKLPVVVIILNNRQLGMIQVEQMMEHYPNFATDLLNPDFARYAETCGGTGIRVSKPEELAPAVERAMRLSGPVIVDVETDAKRF